MGKVLIIGYFGFGNLGDDTALAIVKERFIKVGIAHTVYGEGKSIIERVRGIRNAVRKCSSVLFFGGNLLQNESSTASLVYYLRIINLAKEYGKPIFFASSGIGTIRGLGAALSRNALSGVGFFGARTLGDMLAARRLGATGEMIMHDVCFTLNARTSEKTQTIAYIPKRENKRLEANILAIAERFSLSVTAIPLYYAEDFAVCKKIATRTKIPISVYNSAQSLIDALSQARFTVSERLHGAIFSALAHTVSFIPDSSNKCSSLIAEAEEITRELGEENPILPISALTKEKIKELGARRSEFSKILTYLNESSCNGLSALCRALS